MILIFIIYNGSFLGEVKVNYSNGLRDLCTIFFYSMCWIVIHAVIQEYILDVRIAQFCLYFFTENVKEWYHNIEMINTQY